MRTIMIALLSTIYFGLNAQTFEGTVVYSIEYTNVDEKYQSMMGMAPKEAKIVAKDNFTKTEQSNPAMGGKTVIIVNGETQEMLSLSDVMGQKIAMKMENTDFPTEDELTFSDETETIEGYKCKMLSYEKEGVKMTLYYTEDLPSITMSGIPGVDGFPVRIIMKAPVYTMIQTATSIKEESVADIDFTIPEGYKLMDPKEMQQMMGGGM